jgi:hypothetical protein
MICIDGPRFKDEQGRTLMLRGVNLGGSSKVPYRPNGATHIREGFFDHRNVSFVGRPFPLEEADEHFARLREWGLTFLRFLVTWEAIEHAGPGIYDLEYLDYVYAIAVKAGEYGLQLFIDPHQDVWSRFCGGDGAPGWTLEAVGLDMTRFAETGAAIVHATHGDPFPQMIWPTNYGKLAAATMFTLFFGGNDFAPKTLVEDEPVQEYLQRHYIEAVKQLARRLKDLPHIVGYGTMNEPSAGYIELEDLNTRSGVMQQGAAPTALQGMLLGAGFPQKVERWSLGLTGMRPTGRERLNPEGLRAWLQDYDCIWRENGVWGLDEAGQPCLLRPEHFARVRGRRVDYHRDYWRPFANRFARQIRSVDPDAIIFLEGVPGYAHLYWGPGDAPDVVHAGHWYDGVTLVSKRSIPWFTVDIRRNRLVLGRKRVQQAFIDQVAAIKAASETRMGGIPTLIGEFGIPFDIQNRAAYRTGDFSRQVRALDTTFHALEANLLSGTLWNYTADNTNERGDQWNGEDLSIFSRDQQQNRSSIHSGGRALEAAVRPYARATAGEPLQMSFNLEDGSFELSFRHDSSVEAATEIFVPNLQYPQGYAVEVSDGNYEMDRQSQIITYHHTRARPFHTMRIRRT